MALGFSTLANNPEKLKKFALFMEESGFIKVLGQKAQEFAKNLNSPAAHATLMAIGSLLTGGILSKLLLSDEAKKELGLLGQIYTKTAKTIVSHYLPWLKDLANKVRQFIITSKQKIEQLRESVKTLVEEVEERTFEISPVTYFIATITQLPPMVVENFKHTLEKVFHRIEKRHRFIKIPLIIVKLAYKLVRHPRSTLLGFISSLPFIGKLIASKFKKEDELWKQLIRTIVPFLLGKYGEKLAEIIIDFVEVWLNEYKKSKSIKQIKKDTTKLVGLTKLTLKTQFKPKLNLSNLKKPISFTLMTSGAIVGAKLTKTSKKFDLQSKIFLLKLDNLQRTEKKLLKETKEVSFFLKLFSLLSLNLPSFHLPKLPSISTIFKAIIEWVLGKKTVDFLLTKLLGVKWLRFKRIVRIIWKRKIVKLARRLMSGLSDVYKNFVVKFFSSIAQFFRKSIVVNFASFLGRFFSTLMSRFLVIGGIVGIGLALFDLFFTMKRTLTQLLKMDSLPAVKKALILLASVKETVQKWIDLVLAGIGKVFVKLYDLVTPVVAKVHKWISRLKNSWVAKHIPFVLSIVNFLAKLTGSIYKEIKYYKKWWSDFSTKHIKSAVRHELTTEDINKLANEVDSWVQNLQELGKLLYHAKTTKTEKHIEFVIIDNQTSPIDYNLGVYDE